MELWTDIAEWRGPSPNSGDGDARLDESEDHAVECRGVVLHIAAGYYEGTIAWQRNLAADVSSNFVVSGPRDMVETGTPDGKIAQCVPVDVMAWTQRDGNGHWLSVECSGFVGDSLSPAQIEACAQILAKAHRVKNVPLQLATSPSGRGLGHHSMGAESGANWGHSECPGPAIKAQKPAIVARAIQIVGGSPQGTEDHDMPRLIRYKGGYWISQGGRRRPITNGDTYLRVRAAWPAAAFPGTDKNGFADPDLETQGWTDADIDLAFGNVADQPSTVTVDASAVAAALTANDGFRKAIATQVADELAGRLRG